MMTQRQASVDETRARIVDATIELYETIGPAKTTMSAVADRAGVTRATLYRHFASEDALADAALAAWREGWIGLDEASLAAVKDPDRRLRTGLTALYQGYRATEGMTANLARDAHALPVKHRDAARGPSSMVIRIAGTPVSRRGRGATAAASAAGATVAHAAAFETWQSLRNAGLGDDAIVELMAQLVAIAGSVSAGTPSTKAVAAGRRVRSSNAGGAARARSGPTVSTKPASSASSAAPARRARAVAPAEATGAAPTRGTRTTASSPSAAPGRRARSTALSASSAAPGRRAPSAASSAPSVAPARRTRAAATPSSAPVVQPAITPVKPAKADKPAKAGKGKAGKKAKAGRKAERKAKGGANRGI